MTHGSTIDRGVVGQNKAVLEPVGALVDESSLTCGQFPGCSVTIGSFAWCVGIVNGPRNHGKVRGSSQAGLDTTCDSGSFEPRTSHDAVCLSFREEPELLVPF